MADNIKCRRGGIGELHREPCHGCQRFRWLCQLSWLQNDEVEMEGTITEEKIPAKTWVWGEKHELSSYPAGWTFVVWSRIVSKTGGSKAHWSRIKQGVEWQPTRHEDCQESDESFSNRGMNQPSGTALTEKGLSATRFEKTNLRKLNVRAREKREWNKIWDNWKGNAVERESEDKNTNSFQGGVEVCLGFSAFGAFLKHWEVRGWSMAKRRGVKISEHPYVKVSSLKRSKYLIFQVEF